MAEGGDVQSDMNDDDETLMDHVALECMHALEAKDKEAFMSSLHVLVTDIIEDFSKSLESKEE